MSLEAIEQIYEAAFLPGRWPNALGGIATAGNATYGTIQLFHGDAPPTMFNYNVPEDIINRYTDGMWLNSAATRWGLETRPTHFESFRDNVPEADLEADPAIVMLREVGITDSVIIVHPLASGAMLGVKFDTISSRGHFTRTEVSRLDALRPHLVRSAMLAEKLALERARNMVDTLSRLGIAAAVIDRRTHVIASNPLLDNLSQAFIATAFGGLALSNRTANDRFREAVKRIGITPDLMATSIPVCPDTDDPSVIVNLLPVCGDVRDLLGDGHVLLTASTIGTKAAPEPEVLSGLFDLSRAEIKLVREMMGGGSLPVVAERMGLSAHTVRAQFRSIANKTGLHRQAELLQLLASL